MTGVPVDTTFPIRNFLIPGKSSFNVHFCGREDGPFIIVTLTINVKMLSQDLRDEKEETFAVQTLVNTFRRNLFLSLNIVLQEISLELARIVLVADLRSLPNLSELVYVFKAK